MTGLIDAWQIGVDIVLDDALTGQIAGVASQFDDVAAAVGRLNSELQKLPGSIQDVRGAASGLSGYFTAAAVSAERIQAAMAGTAMPQAGSGGGAYYTPPGQTTSVEPGETPFGGALVPIPGQGASGPQGWGYTGDTGYRPYQPPGAGAAPPGTDVAMFSPGTGWGMPNGSYGDINLPPEPPAGGGGSGGEKDGGDGGFYSAVTHLFIIGGIIDVLAKGAESIVEPGIKFSGQSAKIAAMTPKGTDASAAVASAKVIADQMRVANPGLSMNDALKEVADLYSIDRNMADVSALSLDYARDAFIMSQYQGGDQASKEAYAAMRAAEEAGKLNGPDGKFDPQLGVKFMDLFTKIIVSSGGNISAAGALQMIGQAGAAFTQLDDDAIMRAAVISAVLGPSQTGAGIAALDQEFIGGKMSQGTARQLHAQGILPDTMFYTQGDVGKTIDGYKVTARDIGDVQKQLRWGMGYVDIPAGALPDQTEFLKDPFTWIQTHIFKDYVNPDGSIKDNTPAEVVQMLSDINIDLARITGGRIASIVAFNGQVQNRQIANAANLPPLDSIHETLANTPGAQAGAVVSAVGAADIDLTSDLLNWVTKTETDLSLGMDYILKHPVLGSLKTILDIPQSINNLTQPWGLPDGSPLPGLTKDFSLIGGFLATALHNFFVNDLGVGLKDIVSAIQKMAGQTQSNPVFVKDVSPQSPGPTMPHPVGPTTPTNSQVLPYSGRQMR